MRDLVKTAIDAFVAPGELNSTLWQGKQSLVKNGFWRGAGSLTEFSTFDSSADGTYPNCIVVVEFAKRCLSEEGSDDDIEFLVQQCQRLVEFSSEQQDEKLELARAFAAVVLSIMEIRRTGLRPNGRRAVRLMQMAVHRFDSLWRIRNTRLEPESKPVDPNSHGIDLSKPDQAAAILDWFHRCVGHANDDDGGKEVEHLQEPNPRFSHTYRGMLVSTYLTLHRLISEILADTDKDDDVFVNRALAVTVGGEKQNRKVFGIPVSFVGFSAADLPQGLYLDPFCLGVTPLDVHMKTGLHVAWRIGRQTTGVRFDQVRLEIELNDPRFDSFDGPSAGGIFVAGAIATLQGNRLDEGTTCSIGVQVANEYQKEPEEDRDDLPLTPDQIELIRVGDTDLKAIESWKELLADKLLLHEDDHTTWQATHVGATPRVSPVTTLPELIAAMTRDNEHEVNIARHAKAINSIWSKAIEAVENDIPNVRETSHRFDCYVGPNFKFEGRKQAVGKNGGAQTAGGEQLLEEQRGALQDRETFPVPGDSENDQQLLAILRLFLSEDSPDWAEQPEWLKPGRNIVIYDNAGAGKTVCSYRIQHLLTSQQHRKTIYGVDQAGIVIRIEGQWPLTTDEKAMPIRDVLVRKMQIGLSDRNTDLLPVFESVVDYALKKQRVVVIVDGLDQFQETQVDELVKVFKKDPDRAGVRWIVLGRVHVVDRLRNSNLLFGDNNWNRVRIDPFDDQQQDAYFQLPANTSGHKKPIGDRWLKTIIDRDGMSDILGLPVVLYQIRELIEASDDQGVEPPVFRNLSELYLVTSRMMLQRAIEKNEPAVKSKMEEAPQHLSADQKLDLLEHVLTLMAFQLMLLEEYNGRRSAEQVEQFLDMCHARFFREVDNVDESKIRRSKRVQLQRQIERMDNEWHWAVEMLKTIELFHRSVTEAFNNDGIAFRNRKMVECHAARYLTKYASRWDIFAGDDKEVENDLLVVDPNLTEQDEDQLQSLCAWNYTSHPQWEPTWILAIEMPQTPLTMVNQEGAMQGAVIDPVVTCQSLSALFRRPKEYPDEERAIRPTELMFRAWHLFEYDPVVVESMRFQVQTDIGSDHQSSEYLTGLEIKKLKNGSQLLESLGCSLLLGQSQDNPIARKLRIETLNKFRDANSRQLVAEFDKNLDKVLDGDGNRVSLPADEQERKKLLEQWRQQVSYEKSMTLLQCPPKSLIEKFKSLPADQQVLKNNPLVNDAVEELNGQPVVPFLIQATSVTRGQYALFDPMFEKTGTIEQRISERASSSDNEEYNNNDFPIICPNWFDAWVFCKWLSSGFRLPVAGDWEFACRAGTKTEFHFGNILDGTQANCDGNYPYGVDGDGNKMAAGQLKLDDPPYLERTTPVGDQRYPVNPYGLFDVHGNVCEWCENLLSESGSSRVLRGGSWISDAYFCRSSSPNHFVPSFRDLNYGFRLCRELSS